MPPRGFRLLERRRRILGLRVRRWKVVFAEQRNKGLGVWREPFSMMRIPKSSTCAPTRSSAAMKATSFYAKWFADHDFLMISAQTAVAKWLESFKEFPPRAKAASFTIDQGCGES